MMTEITKRLLIVEDNPGDVDLIRDYLDDADTTYAIADVPRLADAVRHIERFGLPDIVLLDLGLTDSQGMDTLRALLPSVADAPVIVLTIRDNRELAVEAMREGARDYLVKDELQPDLLSRALTAALDWVSENRLRRQAEEELRLRVEEELRLSDSRFRTAFVTAPHGMALVGLDGRFLKVNQKLCELLDYTESELIEADLQSVTEPADLEAVRNTLQEMQSGVVSSLQLETHCVNKAGGTLPMLLSTSLVQDAGGAPLHIVAQMIDLTEREAMEQQLRQAQKMEAVGQLTGGIAHDFNNLLGVIIGNLDLLERSLRSDELGLRRVKTAIEAAERGSELTQRLLAFSRRQALTTRIVDASKLVDGMSELLQRTLGEAIELECRLGTDVWATRTDQSQLEAAVLNLAINARDAMPGGGRLTIETDRATLDKHYASRHREVDAGDYALIAITDTGTGIPPEIIDRVVEPFFTTKERGKGTGLGLSMVFGFVKQSGGHLKLYSEVGQGTTVKLYLPRADAAAPSEEQAADADANDAPWDATVLVVEDKDDVRHVTVEMLEDLGYRVLSASNGASALAVLETAPSVDLLLTDIVMPGGLNGPQLARAACARRPDLKVLYMSGYAESAVLREGQIGPGSNLISKPFRKRELGRAVRDALTG